MIGQELLKQRIRISFDFDVTCNDAPIHNDQAKYDLALLLSFLTADKEMLLHMMVNACTNALEVHESFVDEFLPRVNTNSHHLFEPAIDALHGDEYEYWQEAKEDALPWGDMLSLATEDLFKCFSAEFVESSFEVVSA